MSSVLFRTIPICLMACVMGREAFAQDGTPVKVSVDTQTPGPTVPADFQGLSFEIPTILPDAHGGHYYDPANTSLVTLMKTLGVRNIRFGGTPLDDRNYTISHADIDHVFAFARAIDAKVIYSLRLKNYPDEDKQKRFASEALDAQYIMQKYPDLVDCFALGNEPNAFYKGGFQEFSPDWKQFTAAINSVAPDAKFCGPGAWNSTEKSWLIPFVQQYGMDKNIAYITEHIYQSQAPKYRLPRDPNAKPGNGPGSYFNPPVLNPQQQQILDGLQASARLEMLGRIDYSGYWHALTPALEADHLRYRLEETNSFSGGGVPNASNAYSASLWGLNYELWWASHSAKGINFHTGAKRSDSQFFTHYSVFGPPVQGGQTPLGLSYAMLAFKLVSEGQFAAVTMSKSGSVKLTAYALTGSGGAIFVALINQDSGAGSHAASVTITIPNLSIKNAQGIALAQSTGDVGFRPGASATGAITIGGASIATDGTWSGSWSPAPVGADGRSMNVTVPAASALLLKLSPR